MYSNNGKSKKKMIIAAVGIVIAVVVVAVAWKLGWLAKAKAKLTSMVKKPTVEAVSPPSEAAVASGQATIEVA